MMGGLDSLLSMVQMPKGIPVACVAVDGADNAAILSAQMLALSDEALSDRLVQFKAGMAAEVEAKDHKIQMEEFLICLTRNWSSSMRARPRRSSPPATPNVVIVSYKDDATAFNGLKKGTITGKGAINNRMTNNLMRRLEEKGVPTHYVEELSDRETAVKKVSIVPWRSSSATSPPAPSPSVLAWRRGIVFDAPTIEFSYKNDDLGDPLMNSYHALALKLATQEEIDLIKKYAFAVNDLLRGFMKEIGIDLVDFKLEFGKTADGTIVLADEIPPTPAACGTNRPTRSWTRTVSAGTWAGGPRGGLRGGHAPPDGGSVIHGRFLRRDYQAGLRAGRVLRYRLPLPPGHQAGRHGGLRPEGWLSAADPQH